MQPLTERQEMILQFIRQSIRERGYPPTLREIGARMEIRSTNGVSDHLRALERKGYLRREDMKSRALRPVDEAPGPAGDRDHGAANDDQSASAHTVEVPLLGRVAAGPLSLTADAADERISMDRALLGPGHEVFALRVKGESMIDAGIFDRDVIFVRRTPTAQRGAIVVARVGEEATVKRYFPEKDHVRLQPENKTLSPIIVPKSRAAAAGFEILGVVVGLYRAMH